MLSPCACSWTTCVRSSCSARRPRRARRAAGICTSSTSQPGAWRLAWTAGRWRARDRRASSIRSPRAGDAAASDAPPVYANRKHVRGPVLGGDGRSADIWIHESQARLSPGTAPPAHMDAVGFGRSPVVDDPRLACHHYRWQPRGHGHSGTRSASGRSVRIARRTPRSPRSSAGRRAHNPESLQRLRTTRIRRRASASTHRTHRDGTPPGTHAAHGTARVAAACRRQGCAAPCRIRRGRLDVPALMRVVRSAPARRRSSRPIMAAPHWARGGPGLAGSSRVSQPRRRLPAASEWGLQAGDYWSRPRASPATGPCPGG